MKLWKRVIGWRLKQETPIIENHLNFMLGRSTFEAFYFLNRFAEDIRGNRVTHGFHWFKKTYNKVLRVFGKGFRIGFPGILWRCPCLVQILEKYSWDCNIPGIDFGVRFPPKIISSHAWDCSILMAWEYFFMWKYQITSITTHHRLPSVATLHRRAATGPPRPSPNHRWLPPDHRRPPPTTVRPPLDHHWLPSNRRQMLDY